MDHCGKFLPICFAVIVPLATQRQVIEMSAFCRGSISLCLISFHSAQLLGHINLDQAIVLFCGTRWKVKAYQLCVTYTHCCRERVLTGRWKTFCIVTVKQIHHYLFLYHPYRLLGIRLMASVRIPCLALMMSSYWYCIKHGMTWQVSQQKCPLSDPPGLPAKTQTWNQVCCNPWNLTYFDVSVSDLSWITQESTHWLHLNV